MTAGRSSDRTPRQTTLPFEEADDPIPYALTARARRTVAPGSLPDLSVVPEPDAGEPDPFDPRPARARALRRAGRDTDEIAGLLDVDVDLAAAWCRTVGPRADRRRGRSTGAGAGSAGTADSGQVRRLPLPETDRSAHRESARVEAVGLLGDVGGEVLVTAFVAGRARITPHAVTFPVDDPDEAARIIGWLADLAGVDPSRARLVVEVAAGTAHDVAQARWQQGTGVSAEHVTVSGGRHPRATLRIADPDIAATLAGWQDALMEVSTPSVPEA